MFSSQNVGDQKSKSVLNFVTNVVTADDLNLLADQEDYERDFIQINGTKINEIKQKHGLRKIDKPRVKNNEEYKIYKN
jgi:trans-2-enoyl-CoA reductase